MVDGTFRHNDRRCGGQLRGRFPSRLGRDRNSKLLLSEAATATNSRQSSLYQQTKFLRYGSYEGGKVIIYSRIMIIRIIYTFWNKTRDLCSI